MNTNALGLIEVYGYIPAVEALDSALKAANVNLVCAQKVQGGLVTVVVEGDVGAVNAAISASEVAANRVGKVISMHVIARPSEDVYRMLKIPIEDKKQSEEKISDESDISIEQKDKVQISHPEKFPEHVDSDEVVIQEDEMPKDNPVDKILSTGDGVTTSLALDVNALTEEQLSKMKVVELRRVARKMKLDNITGKKIKYAKKEELLEKINEFRNRRDG